MNSWNLEIDACHILLLLPLVPEMTLIIVMFLRCGMDKLMDAGNSSWMLETAHGCCWHILMLVSLAPDRILLN